MGRQPAECPDPTVPPTLPLPGGIQISGRHSDSHFGTANVTPQRLAQGAHIEPSARASTGGSVDHGPSPRPGSSAGAILHLIAEYLPSSAASIRRLSARRSWGYGALRASARGWLRRLRSRAEELRCHALGE